jgi:hypothetical protein
VTEIPDVGPVSGLVDVWVQNGTETSGGNGPGHVRVPPGEAAYLVGARLAVYGSRAPARDGTEQALEAMRRSRPWRSAS